MNKTLYLKVLRHAYSDMPELQIKKSKKLIVAVSFEEESGTVVCENENGEYIDFHMSELELFKNQRYGYESDV